MPRHLDLPARHHPATRSDRIEQDASLADEALIVQVE
jgi:hypothetical protein